MRSPAVLSMHILLLSTSLSPLPLSVIPTLSWSVLLASRRTFTTTWRRPNLSTPLVILINLTDFHNVLYYNTSHNRIDLIIVSHVSSVFRSYQRLNRFTVRWRVNHVFAKSFVVQRPLMCCRKMYANNTYNIPIGSRVLLTKWAWEKDFLCDSNVYRSDRIVTGG